MKRSLPLEFRLFIASMLLTGITSPLDAATAITAFHSPVVFDFQSFTGSGFSPTPISGQLNSNNWSVTGFSDGNLDFGATGTTGDFARGTSTGGVTTGGVYAFETGSGNIALGVQPIGADFTPGSFILRLQNQTGSAITTLQISYDLFVLNNADRSNSLNFSYAIGDSALPGSFVPVSAFDFVSEAPAESPAAWQMASMSTSVFGLDLGPGAYFYMSWTGDDVGGADSRDEFAIDNISISAVPEPASSLLGFLLATGLWYRRR